MNKKQHNHELKRDYYSGYCKYRSFKMSNLFSWATQVCNSTGSPFRTHNNNDKYFKIATVRSLVRSGSDRAIHGPRKIVKYGGTYSYICVNRL